MSLRSLKLLAVMSWFEAQRFRTYPLEIFAQLAARLIEATLFIVFWLLVGKYSSSGSIVPRDVISYYLIISGLTPFFYLGFGLGSETVRMINRGELNQILIRPVDPILYPWANRTGRSLINLGFGLVQVILGILIAGGIRAQALPLLLPVLVNALLINLAFNIFIGTAGFYTGEGLGIKNTFYHVANLCRGGLMPLYLMPAGLLTALQFTPFPASQYHLTILLQGRHTLAAWPVVVGSLWAVTLMYMAVKAWQAGLKQYEAVGI